MSGPAPASKEDASQSGLSKRLGILLSVALVPLGLIALQQTIRLEDDLRAQTERALLATTLELAEQERLSIRAAFGAAEALAVAARGFENTEECTAFMRRFVANSNGDYLFAGVIPPSGLMACSSSGTTADVSETEDFQQSVATPRARVDVSRNGAVSGAHVVVVTVPFGGTPTDPAGFLSLSLPHAGVEGAPSVLTEGLEKVVFTLNQRGELLTSSLPLSQAEAQLPADRGAFPLVGGGSREFVAPRADGTPTYYTIIPIVDGTMYAVGAWPDARAHGTGWLNYATSPALFAVFMWLASLILVTFTVERQVVGPVRVLAARMRRFGLEREMPPEPRKDLPRELQVIETEFRNVAERLVQDEADLVNAMHEKDVLLKEVHHRVKNNLQLISSMINMQERRAEEEETVAALDHISQRVSSMATVHRLLYQAEALSKVHAEDLLARVTAPLTELAPARSDGQRLRVRSEFASVLLYPDQALPLSLLTVEAVTNALKYAGDAGEGPWVRIALERLEGDRVALVVENSVAEAKLPEVSANTRPSSLGGRLINSFARQLGAAPNITSDGEIYRLRVVFEPMPFDADEQSWEAAAATATEPRAAE